MALEDHPHVFHFEGRLWVSELPRDDMRTQFAAQRAWDAANLKSEHWTLAIVLGAVVGTGATLAVGTAAGIAPALYLFVLPIGFAFGVVLASLVNRRLVAASRPTAPTTPRPELAEVTRVPSAVARKTDETTPVTDLIAWSKQGFVPDDRRAG